MELSMLHHKIDYFIVDAQVRTLLFVKPAEKGLPFSAFRMLATKQRRVRLFLDQRSVDFLKRFKARSEEHTSELQSHLNLVCRLLLEKKKEYNKYTVIC